LANTVEGAAPDIMIFLLLLGVVFASYSYMANLLFGAFIDRYARFEHTMVTLFLVTMGEFEYEEFTEVDKIFASVFFFTFIILVFFVLLNIFIGIINEAYAQESAKPRMAMADEFSGFVGQLRHDMAAPFIRMMDKANELKKRAEDKWREVQEMAEARQRWEALGRNVSTKLRDHEMRELAKVTDELWWVPIDKAEDLLRTHHELLKEYRPGLDDAIQLVEDVRLAGKKMDGSNIFDLELKALDGLVTKFEQKIEATEAAIEEEKAKAREERRLQLAKERGEDPDDVVVEEENPLLEAAAGDGEAAVEAPAA